jgi:uncharacterized protein YjeT (DUF2065 family)
MPDTCLIAVTIGAIVSYVITNLVWSQVFTQMNKGWKEMIHAVLRVPDDRSGRSRRGSSARVDE